MNDRTQFRRTVPMSARDSLNYFLETERTRASIVHAIVLDTAAAADPSTTITDHADAVAWVRSRLHVDPFFTRRLDRSPFDLAFPRWVDTEVNVGEHVFVWRPAPADAATFVNDKIVELSTTAIGWDRPPWQFHFVLDCRGVDGVPDGGTVMLFDTHHCAADGMGVVDLMTRVMSPDPSDPVTDGGGATGPGTTGRDDAESLPDNSNHGATAVLAVGRSALELPAQMVRVAAAAVARARGRRALDTGPHADIAARREHGHRPATRFNRNVPPAMVLGLAWFDLDRLKRMKQAHGSATLNDVLMTVISLAVSQYLSENGELPDRSIAASIPINTRPMTGGSASAAGSNANQLTIATLDLHTDIADPSARLDAVHESAAEAKALAAVLTASMPPSPLLSAPAALLSLLSKMPRSAPAEPEHAPISTMTTNIPYGAGPYLVAGAPVVGVYAPLMTAEGVQLSHALMSVGSSLSISAVSNPAVLPDMPRYMSLVERAVDTLEASLASRPVETGDGRTSPLARK